MSSLVKIKNKLNNKTINDFKSRIINKVRNKPNAIPIIICSVITFNSMANFLFNFKGGKEAIYIHFLILIQFIAAIGDINKKLIPLQLMLGALLAGTFTMLLFDGLAVFKEHLVSGGLAFFILLFLMLISKGQIGGGDLALFMVTGFFTGIPSMFSILFLSVIVSGIFSLVIVIYKKGGKKSEIPFAPFLLLATSISAMFI
ncbi:MAG: prepilin signal peptidase PulO-like peptidase [Eubacterium sp.]|jgi:Flp pilus assembly protein protease CpaA|nr:prepilin signal peptidase PulO-like peptidase [Eubacterium sp.]